MAGGIEEHVKNFLQATGLGNNMISELKKIFKITSDVIHQYEFHLAEVKWLRDQIQNDISIFTKKRDQYKTLHKIASGFNVGGGTISIIAGGSGMAALVGGITTPLAIPLGCISLGAIAITGLSTYTMYSYSKGREKYSRLIEIANSVIKKINDIISEALKDRIFSEVEYRRMVDQYKQYRKDIRTVYQRNRVKTSKNSQKRFPEGSKTNLRRETSR